MSSDDRQYCVEASGTRPTRVEQPTTRYKALTGDTDGAYTFGEHFLAMDFPPHVHHREDEGIYVLEGTLIATIGDETHSLGPGDFAFMPKGVPHALSAGSDPRPRFIFVSTPGGFEHTMDDFIEASHAGHPVGSAEWREVETRRGLEFL